MIKCIASDMDGTLLNSKQEVSEKNLEAIQKALNSGVEVVIATGRSYEEAISVLQESGLQLPIICANGAEIRTKEGEVVKAHPLDHKIAKQAADVLNQVGIYYEIYTSEETYTVDYDKGVEIIIDIFTTANPELSRELVEEEAQHRYDKGLIHIVDSYEPILNGEKTIYKLLVFHKDHSFLDEVEEKLKQIDNLEVTSSAFGNLELMNTQAQKGIALAEFVEEKGIALQDTMAVGDNYNDLSMFRVVGRSVAMGNANDDIKERCTHVTLRNDESGVGEAILQALAE
ncbi:Cof-type HAD-IIB family hydrolase [Robertmurraya korlensis]|uniref:Cof-type HAD-IIB family hydrolase n=1 Tax=Robertmurraya korlensis TaxID=519977 RepID=UPI00203E10CA|nr:Cof-type HAD-IIB family hydrolase [Robertmurraya korlensis]MCM3602024.1 Cof-type HAD-IIB family hydrolase [Robertmurraya korlensis]